jgi:hypothetical protein
MRRGWPQKTDWHFKHSRAARISFFAALTSNRQRFSLIEKFGRHRKHMANFETVGINDERDWQR